MISGLDDLTTDGATDVATSDAGDEASDAALDVGSCESGACGAPLGFQPVLFASDRNTACPAGATSIDAVVDPLAPPNGCPCECTYQPTCLPQPDTFEYGILSCTTPITINAQLDGGCNAISPSLGNGSFHAQMGPFSPANACTNAVKTPGTVSTTTGRLCSVTDCSACVSIPGFSLCYAQSGDVPCPSSLKTKHTVGTDANLSCSACSLCTSTAKCRGSLQMFSDTACATPNGTLTVDGTCQGFSSSDIHSLKYTPTLEQGTCTAGTSSASVAVAAQTTVCCP